MAAHNESKKKLAEVESGPLWNDPKYFMPQESTNEKDNFSKGLISSPSYDPKSLLTDVFGTSSAVP